jgi:hypothetical protein
MAKAPTCKVCGTAHWSGQPHAFEKAEAAAQAPIKRVTPPKAVTGPSLPPSVPPDALAVYLATKRAAQAAYMRDYRAKKATPKAPKR